MLGSLYLYDRKAIFYRDHNQYHLFKEGTEYIVHSHSFKNDRSLGNTQKLKRVVNASWNLALMSMQCQEKKNPKHKKEVPFHYHTPVMIDSVSMVKIQHDMGTMSFKCSILVFSLLLINSIWFTPAILNEDFVEKWINVLKNINAVLIVVMMIQVYRL